MPCRYRLPSSAVLSNSAAILKKSSKSMYFLSPTTDVTISSSWSGVTTPSSSISSTPCEVFRAVTSTLSFLPFSKLKPSIATDLRIAKLGRFKSSSLGAVSFIIESFANGRLPSTLISGSNSSTIFIGVLVAVLVEMARGVALTDIGAGGGVESSSSSSSSSNSSRSVVMPSMAS